MARITQIQVRRDTASNWSTLNPKLEAGEIGFDTTNNIFKIGPAPSGALWNSITKYAVDASYVTGSALSTSVTTATGLTSIGTLGSLSVTGTTTSGSFIGSGSGITNLNMGNVSGANTLSGQYGGTGVNNSGKTITLGGNLTTSGAFNTTLTATGTTSLTLPNSGTLALNDLSNVTPATGRSALEVQKQPLFYTGPDTTTVVASSSLPAGVFVGPYNKSVTLDANMVYEVDILWYVGLQTASTTGPGVYSKFNYTGTLDSTNPILGQVVMYSNGTGATQYIGRDAGPQGIAATIIIEHTNTSSAFGTYYNLGTGNNTVYYRVFVIKAIVRTATSGQFYYGIAIQNSSADATYTTYKNSYIKVTPLGTNSGSTISNGTWT